MSRVGHCETFFCGFGILECSCLVFELQIKTNKVHGFALIVLGS